MNDQVEEVKQKTDIVSLIGSYVELKKAGSKYKGNCPFHSEKTPSFIVSPEIQIYKCFGCQKSGDVFTFLEEYEGMEFYEALKYLAEKAGIKLKTATGPEKGLREKLYEINLLVLKFYQYCLLKHESGKNALNYLTRERGLTLNTINKFKIGFSPNEPLALKQFVIGRNKITYKDLEQTGITYSGNRGTFDRFRGRVTFPLFDHRGNIAGFAGRILPDSTNKDFAKYINTPETLIYKKSQILFGLNETKADIKRVGSAIIVEGEFDLINSWQVGIKNIVAIKGSALTEEQIKLLSRYAKTLILALDEDFAGNEAALRGIKIAEKEGLEIKVARLKNFKDPADAALGNPDELKNAVECAVDVWDFIVNFIFSKYEGESGNVKAKIGKEITPMLSSIENKIVQAHYINLVAKKLNVPTDAVAREIAKVNQNKFYKPLQEFSKAAPISKSRREILEENLLAIIFKVNPRLLLKKDIFQLFTSSFDKRLITEYKNFTELSRSKLSEFKDQLPEELKVRFIDIVLKEVEDIPEHDEIKLKDELNMIIKNLKIFDIKSEISKLTEIIKNSEEYGKIEELNEAQRRFFKLTKDLSELEAKNFKGIIL